MTDYVTCHCQRCRAPYALPAHTAAHPMAWSHLCQACLDVELLPPVVLASEPPPCPVKAPAAPCKPRRRRKSAKNSPVVWIAFFAFLSVPCAVCYLLDLPAVHTTIVLCSAIVAARSIESRTF